MATLIEIQHEIKNALSALEDCEPEQQSELQQTVLDYLDDLATAEAEKIDSYAFIIREQQSRIELLKAEEKRIANRRKAAENGLKRLKERLVFQLQTSGLQKVSGLTSTVSLRKSESVCVECVPEALPAGLYIEKKEYKADKKAIKEAIKEGRKINGCSIVKNESLIIR